MSHNFYQDGKYYYMGASIRGQSCIIKFNPTGETDFTNINEYYDPTSHGANDNGKTVISCKDNSASY